MPFDKASDTCFHHFILIKCLVSSLVHTTESNLQPCGQDDVPLTQDNHSVPYADKVSHILTGSNFFEKKREKVLLKKGLK
ncbi:hypothetical protein AVEN_128789-1 [Araneus ventricosus]|uniref:Uncharacterized protein n=1 Tax=Araneus ventricosus TaxID=182803 RepID=A0A4Y2VU82_ARAVE|nr:hypothetical protein AVEN_128789-1 [Araneus ventricosus]